MTLPPGLGTTYRLQLVPGAGFARAAAQVGYLADLGVETLYLSPIAEAVPGSTHGYDGTDPTCLRAELGGAAAYDGLVAACAAHGLGIMVDHVPNHLATWTGGGWWRRLLAEGRDSAVGEAFDVAWDEGPPAARGKVALPILDQPLDQALAAHRVTVGARDGHGVVLVGDLDLPVAGGTVRDGEDVAEVLAAQHYRLVDWHDRADRNYRRFFDIDGLAGVRVEVPAVFAATHALVVDLARRGALSAIRVDHVDGLRDPAAYLARLRAETGVPVVVEKILSGDEVLPGSWPVVGTTGYEALDVVGGLLVHPDGFDRLVEAGRGEGDPPVGPLTVETRRLVAETSFVAETRRVAGRLEVPRSGFVECAVRLGRYRTYLEADAPDSAEDAAVWRAAAGTRPGAREAADAVLDPRRRAGALDAQQLTGALMAKGVEDTAWYRLAGPLPFCEVGGEPGRDRHDASDRWHRWCRQRAGGPHHGLVPGTTHDTKRAADVRARLYALSEVAPAFEEGLAALRAGLGTGRDLLGETRTLAQLLLGVLPPLGPAGGAQLGDAVTPGGERLAERVGDALTKGAREAKLRSSWDSPDEAYEGRLRALAAAALAAGGAPLRRAFGDTVLEVARLGAVNSLSAVVLRHVAPGVPDCYQGDEVWNLSLVDPDNRRPVDAGALADALSALRREETDPAALRTDWPDGRVKLWVTARCLAARRGAGALEPGAEALAVRAVGPAAPSIVATARRAGSGEWALAVVTRLAGSLPADAGDLPAGPSYATTAVLVGDGAPTRWVDALSGRVLEVPDGRLEAADVLADLPVALLTAVPGGARR